MFLNIFLYIGENGLTSFKRKLDAFAEEMLCAEFIFSYCGFWIYISAIQNFFFFKMYSFDFFFHQTANSYFLPLT